MRTIIIFIIVVFSFSTELFSQASTGIEMVSNEEMIVYKYILSELPLIVDLQVKRFPFSINDSNKDEIGIPIPFYPRYCDTCNYIAFVYYLSAKLDLSLLDSNNAFDSIVLENIWNSKTVENHAKLPFLFLCSGNFSYLIVDSLSYTPVVRNSNSYFLGNLIFTRVLFNDSGGNAFVSIFSLYAQKTYKFLLEKRNDKWRIVKYDSYNVLF